MTLALLCAALLAGAAPAPLTDASAVGAPDVAAPTSTAVQPGAALPPSPQGPTTRPDAATLYPSAAPPGEVQREEGASSPFPAEGDGRPARTGGPYYYSRWAEDWSFLRDRSKSTDLFDPLKFIPLNADHSTYLTLSGTARVGSFILDNVGLNPNGKALDAGLFRGYIGADLHLTSWLRFYGELATADIGGSNFHSVIPIYRSTLFVHQAFAEVGGQFAGAQIGGFVGRMDYTDGP
jgi:hypothetical protein